MHRRFISFLFIVILARTACAADGGVDTCNALPAKFAEIKANLALHTKVMTQEEIEKAVTQGPISIGRGFAYNFAFLLDYLYNEIADWIVLGRTCNNVNQLALLEEDEVCGKQTTDFLIKWKNERTDEATSELDRGRKIAAGKTLAVRLSAICFVGMEAQLFASASPVKRPDNFLTRVVPSPLPLNLTIAADFTDVTKTIYAGDAPQADFSVYCHPADAQLLRDQLRGERPEEQTNKGCFFLKRDASASYDAGAKRFSVENDLEAMKKGQSSTSPRFELRILSFGKRDIRGIPTLAVVQHVKSEVAKERIHFLYAFHGGKVWLVQFVSGKQEDLGTAIWDAFINGL